MTRLLSMFARVRAWMRRRFVRTRCPDCRAIANEPMAAPYCATCYVRRQAVEQPMPPAVRRETPVIQIPALCANHQHELVVHRLQIPESGPWVLAMIIMDVLLFQWATKDPGIWKRADGEVADLTLVLAEIGCLACRYPDGFGAAVRVLQKGIDHAAAVSQARATDPDWPVLTATDVQRRRAATERADPAQGGRDA